MKMMNDLVGKFRDLIVSAGYLQTINNTRPYLWFRGSKVPLHIEQVSVTNDPARLCLQLIFQGFSKDSDCQKIEGILSPNQINNEGTLVTGFQKGFMCDDLHVIYNREETKWHVFIMVRIELREVLIEKSPPAFGRDVESIYMEEEPFTRWELMEYEE